MREFIFLSSRGAVMGVVLSIGLLGCSSQGTPSPSTDASADRAADALGAADGRSARDGGPPARDAALDAGGPLCDQPDPLVAVPGAPHGIYVVEFPGPDFDQEFVPLPSYLVDNPVVCGGNIVIPWSEVDRGPTVSPQYDFASIDALIAPWTAAGKKVNLLVFAIGNGKNATTPSYVLDQVQKVTTCMYADPYPLVWTKEFVSLYEPFVAEVVSRYGSDPSVGYIRVGLSIGAQSDVTCATSLEPQGLTEPIWESYVSTMVDYERTLAHTVPLMLGFGPYGAGGPTGDITLPDWEAALAADAGFGMGNQGLSAADVAAVAAGGHCNADWCALFDEYTGKVPLYLQPLGPTSPDGGGYGSLASILPFALSYHMQIFELDDGDLQIAYDPTNPLYATDAGADYRQALESAAKVLGSKR